MTDKTWICLDREDVEELAGEPKASALNQKSDTANLDPADPSIPLSERVLTGRATPNPEPGAGPYRVEFFHGGERSKLVVEGIELEGLGPVEMDDDFHDEGWESCHPIGVIVEIANAAYLAGQASTPEKPTGTIFELDMFRERLERLAGAYEAGSSYPESILSRDVGGVLHELAAELKTLIDNCQEQYASPEKPGLAVALDRMEKEADKWAKTPTEQTNCISVAAALRIHAEAIRELDKTAANHTPSPVPQGLAADYDLEPKCACGARTGIHKRGHEDWICDTPRSPACEGDHFAANTNTSETK